MKPKPYSIAVVCLIAGALLLGISTSASAAIGDQLFKITAGDAAAGDQFGTSSAMDGTVAIVGAPRDDDAGTSSGSAYLYDVTAGTQLFKLTASDATSTDEFGTKVAISGNVAIVGAQSNDDPVAGINAGSAYLFDATTGTQLFKLLSTDLASGDFFGQSVAISGNVAIVGAFGDDDAGSTSGSAYLFDVTTGTQLMKLTASDAAAGDFFGNTVAIDGNRALVQGGGAVYVFDVSTGSELFKLVAPTGIGFGGSLSVSGGVALIGAANENDAGTSSGSAYLFDVNTGAQLFKLTASDAAIYDTFGSSVGIDGGTAIVGAQGVDVGANVNAGAAYLFDVATGTELAKVTASDGAASDNFGHSAGISGGVAVVGAHAKDDAGSNSGAVYLYDTTAGPGAVTFRLEDQYGVEIPASKLVVNPGNVTVATGSTVSLAPGSYTVRLEPGLAGISGGATYLHRAEPLTVTGGAQSATYEWKTAALTVTIVDQAAVAIPSSQYRISGGGGNGWGQITSGTAVTVPVTEGYPTISGTYAGGYPMILSPGLAGTVGGLTYLIRTETGVEVPDTGTNQVFEWKTAALTVTIVDQAAVAIPSSQYRISGGGGNGWGQITSGTAVTVPVTEGYPTISGTYAGGYPMILSPGLAGTVGGLTYLTRTETGVEVPDTGTNQVFEWKTAALTVTIVDQAAVAIPSSQYRISGGGGNGWGQITSGTAVTVPVTEGYPTIGGTYAGGYPMILSPGLAGTLGGLTYLTRNEAGVEVPDTGTNQVFEWEVGSGTIHVVDGSEAEFIGGSFAIQFSSNITWTSGDAFALPVTEGYPSIGGIYSDGYDVNFTNPAGGTFAMELNPGEVWDPLFVDIGGNDFGLRLNLPPMVTFRLEDQYGVEIPASKLVVNPGNVTVATGSTVSLAPGSYTVRLEPGLAGISGGATYLHRAEPLTVTGGAQSATYEWKTAALTVTIVDQAAVAIPSSQYRISGGGGNGWGQITSGTAVTVPVTEGYPTISGTYAGGYPMILSPGLAGTVGGLTYLIRTETGVEVPDTGTNQVFEWKTAALTVTIVDQAAVAIPSSQYRISGGGGNGWGQITSGTAVTVPVTEGYPTISGTYAGGYPMILSPGLAGTVGGLTYLTRTETGVEVPDTGTNQVFEWKTAALTVTIVDQAAVAIPSSQYRISGGGGNGWGQITSGTAVTVPVTEGYPTIGGTYAGGYPMILSPGLAGTLGGLTYLTRNEAGVEVPDTGTNQVFEWEVGSGTIHVVDGSEAEFIGGSFAIQFSSNITWTSGDAFALPVTEGYPSIGGIYSDGYDVNFTNPAGGTFAMELNPGEVWDPLFVDIGGNDFGLRLNLITDVTVNGVVSACNGPLQGVTVDLNHPDGSMYTTATDSAGAYAFPGLPGSSDSAIVAIVVPLGYAADVPSPAQALVPLYQDQSTVDFSLTCLNPDSPARSMGYWKHQANVFLNNKGNAQESEVDMETNYPNEVFNHFFENQLNSIEVEGVTFMISGTDSIPLDLGTIHETLSVKGKAGMEAKAKQQYLAMLLNIASGKLLTSSVISDDQGTASQALQQVTDYINDGDPSNDETAKDICDVINNAQLVASGIIDLGYDTIAYRRGSAPHFMGAVQNPFRGASQIRYRLNDESRVDLAVLDIQGRMIRTLVAGTEPAGEHTVMWDGRDSQGRSVGSGVYYLSLRTGEFRAYRSVVRLR